MTDTLEAEELAPRKVYWQGRQWCVTDYGLETIKRDRYYIEAKDLGDLTEGSGRDEEPCAERLRHVGAKTWVDIEDLAGAFAVALQVHEGKYAPLPRGAFHNALATMRWSKLASEAYRSLRTEEEADLGVDFGRGSELVAEAQEQMRSRYPDRRALLEVVHLPAPIGEP